MGPDPTEFDTRHAARRGAAGDGTFGETIRQCARAFGAGTRGQRSSRPRGDRRSAGITLAALIVGFAVVACGGGASTLNESPASPVQPAAGQAATPTALSPVPGAAATPATPGPSTQPVLDLVSLSPTGVAQATKAAGDATLNDRTKQLAAGGGEFRYAATITVTKAGTYAHGSEQRCGTGCRGDIAVGEWWRVGSRSLFRSGPSDQSDPGSHLRYGLTGQDGWLDDELARADPTWVGVLPVTDYRISARVVRADGGANLMLRATRHPSDPGISISATQATVGRDGRLTGWSQTIQSTFGDKVVWTRTITYRATSVPASPLAGIHVAVPPVVQTSGVPFDWTQPIVRGVAADDAGRALLEAPPMAEDAFGYSVRLEPRDGAARVVSLPVPALSIQLVGATAVVVTRDGHVLEIGLSDGRVADTGPIVAAPAFFGAEVGTLDGALVATYVAGHVESGGGRMDQSVPDHAGLAVLRDGTWHVVSTQATSDPGTPVMLQGACGFLHAERGSYGGYKLSFAGLDCMTGAPYRVDLGLADTWVWWPDGSGPALTYVPESATQALLALADPSGIAADTDQLVLIAKAPRDLVFLDLGLRGPAPAAIFGGTAFYLSGGGLKSLATQTVGF
ncbi:MAG: hypothetical protein P4L84_36480 [Isosphaeraceae bacterium]|nr:hypothetical protein [Isosphaeraceae bacterium]